MVKSIKIICGFFLILSGVASASQIHIQNWQTKAGSQVFFVRTTTVPMLEVRLVFAAGSAYDGKHWGLAAMTNNLLAQETDLLTADQIADKFDRVGAVFTHDTTRDMGMVSLRTLVDPKYMTKALDTFTEVLTKAQFDATSFGRIMNKTQAVIKVGMQSPNTVATNQFFQALYGKQAYAHPVEGTLDSLKTINLDLIRSFYQRYYVAKNADIVLVGDITKAQAIQIAEQLSQKMPVGKVALALSNMTTPAKSQHINVNFPSSQTTILLGQLGITRHNPSYFPLVVGNAVLGGLPMTSLLFQNVRNKRGLAYGAYSQFDPLRFIGPFLVQLQTRDDKAGEAVNVVQNTVADYVKQGPTPAQLKAAKQYISGSFPLSIATNKDIMTQVMNIAFYKRPLNYLDTFIEHIDGVTVDQVRQSFEKTLHPTQMILVTVGSGMHAKKQA